MPLFEKNTFLFHVALSIGLVSFRLAAIRILEEAGQPLHYEEITKRALERNLIETVEATPEYTMDGHCTTFGTL